MKLTDQYDHCHRICLRELVALVNQIKISYMKAIISLALLLGLSIVSCKKEVQTTTPVTTDTSAVDSMDVNSVPPDTAGITTSQKESTAAGKMKDSARVGSK